MHGRAVFSICVISVFDIEDVTQCDTRQAAPTAVVSVASTDPVG